MNMIQVIAHHHLDGSRYIRGSYLVSDRGALRSMHLALLQLRTLTCDWSLEVDGRRLPDRWLLDEGDAWLKAQEVVGHFSGDLRE